MLPITVAQPVDIVSEQSFIYFLSVCSPFSLPFQQHAHPCILTNTVS